MIKALSGRSVEYRFDDGEGRKQVLQSAGSYKGAGKRHLDSTVFKGSVLRIYC